MVKFSSPLFISPSSRSPATGSIQTLWQTCHCHRFGNRLWDHYWKYLSHQVSPHWFCVWVRKALLSIRRPENFGLFTDVSFAPSSPRVYFRLRPGVGVLAVPMRSGVWDAETNGQKSINGQPEPFSRNTVPRTVQPSALHNSIVDNSLIPTHTGLPSLHPRLGWPYIWFPPSSAWRQAFARRENSLGEILHQPSPVHMTGN